MLMLMGICPRTNQGKSNNKVVFKINFKVFIENVKKAEGTISSESIYEKKRGIKKAGVHYSSA